MRKVTVRLEASEQDVEVSAPTVSLLKRADNLKGGDIAKAIFIMSACTNMTEKQIEELDVLDYQIIQGELDDFLKVPEKKKKEEEKE
ncbi:MAG: phage tail assembly protein [Campylobacteraceae bacterium]